MLPSIEDQVIDFYNDLFDHIFSVPFRAAISPRLRRKAVIRQVEEAADAASQSLTRFFLNQQLSQQQVADIFDGLSPLPQRLKLHDIANVNVTPETLVETLLSDLPYPEAVQQAGQEAVYRVALHAMVQVLKQVGPVMIQWQKLNFASTFELPRRVVNRLNQITEQLDTLGHSGQVAVDERYELTYRDYLLQRFHRVEAGTVRMTTNLDVDLRELFVMPRIEVRPLVNPRGSSTPVRVEPLMDLNAARKRFATRYDFSAAVRDEDKKEAQSSALEQIKHYPHNIIIGAPGGGKSTFLEWLQVKVASVEEELIMNDQQAIPLLLRVRQLDPHNLPQGAEMIAQATASQDRAALMPLGWLQRQLEAGRVLFMLDGLDETEPELRDQHVLPWLLNLKQQYPDCRYLVSSRPVGYSAQTLKTLQKFKFVDCDLLDFAEAEISQYTVNWCTAVRLAQNELEDEARREGATEGQQIVDGFQNHPYIRDLARTPLMLSAICLANYFEGGQLPDDRAMLYKLCVEGLLHHWDQRRGIHATFTLTEKLRACREVALAMQAADRAEYKADQVQQIFSAVLQDSARAEMLLEHIRYRTGLLIERRPGIFAFAHLTFQEYLAAQAIYEGNLLELKIEHLVRDHKDGRWQEVLALYCGLTPTPVARNLLQQLLDLEETFSLSTILTEAFLSSGPELKQDQPFRQSILEGIARLSCDVGESNLQRFPSGEVAPLANRFVGTPRKSTSALTEAHQWLKNHPQAIDFPMLITRLQSWDKMDPFQLAELIHLLHRYSPEAILAKIATHAAIYAAAGPKFPMAEYTSQAEVAMVGLETRAFKESQSLIGVDAAFLQVLRVLSTSKKIGSFYFTRFLERRNLLPPPQNSTTWPEFISLTRRLVEYINNKIIILSDKDTLNALNNWINLLEQAIAEKNGATHTLKENKS